MADPTLPPGAWAPVHAAARRLLSPIQRFLQVEAASGLVLIAATAVALAWANSPWAGSYLALWHTDLTVTLGSWSFARPLHFWVNDGLMTIFFFVVWAGLYQTGIHPTLAGVILGLLTPVRAWSSTADELEPESSAAHLQHALHRWVAFAIMPLFALANAGVALGGASLGGGAGFILLGIIAGLVLGKPIGILLACRLGVGAGVALRPSNVSNSGLAVVGVVAGIGFTMSLFIAQLAFPPGPLLETAKLAILIGSCVAAVSGLLLGVRRLPAAGEERGPDAA